MPPHGCAHGHGFGTSRPAAVPAWVPSDESGLLLWYDAKSTPSHSLYQESTGSPPGTTLADTDGETIGTWRDNMRTAEGLARQWIAAHGMNELVNNVISLATVPVRAFGESKLTT